MNDALNDLYTARVLGADDWLIFKTLRLQAAAALPTPFKPVAEDTLMSEQDWRIRCTAIANECCVVGLFDEDGHLIGSMDMAAPQLAPGQPKTGDVLQHRLYIQPSSLTHPIQKSKDNLARHLTLFEKGLKWANRQPSFNTIIAAARDKSGRDDRAAYDAYARLGFVPMQVEPRRHPSIDKIVRYSWFHYALPQPRPSPPRAPLKLHMLLANDKQP